MGELERAASRRATPLIRISVSKLMTVGDDRCELVFEEE